jgi:hypothetical protein
MSQATKHDRLREILESEAASGDIGIGVGVEQFFKALKSGRVSVDLFDIPDDKRLDVYREIVALVERRRVQLGNIASHPPESVTAAG